jgi:RimJ/RimL family protein N-acetyltransferase
MTHPIWPLFDLRVVTPRLELRYVDDDLCTELAILAAQGVHDPSYMPFSVPWTDAASPELERNTLQYYWRCRADTTPSAWSISLAVLLDGHVVGTTALIANDFPTLRQFETGSWLGREHQGRGIGKEMRHASLQLGFLGFGADWAVTAAFHDNGPSLGVTNRLGYQEQGRRRAVRRNEPSMLVGYEMSRADFVDRLHRNDISLHGIDDCLPLLGLAPRVS